MAEKGQQVERQAVPTKVDTRTIPARDDKPERSVWKISFEGGVQADTWSAEAAKVCEDNIGKPLLVTVEATGRQYQDKDVFNVSKIKSADGTTELYSGGQGKRGGQRGNYSQRPDWSYEDRAEREERARSIEAQVAAKATAEYFGYLIQYGDHQDDATAKLLTVDGALEFQKKMAAEIGKGIRKAAQVRSPSASKSGPGVAERPSPDPGNRTQGSESSSSADGGEVSTETPLLSPSGEQGAGTLASGPDSGAELAEARNLAIEVFGTISAVQKAFAMVNDGTVVKFNDLTAEQLASLAANPPSGTQKESPEVTAGMAGGWS